MILVGNRRGGAAEMAAHLMNMVENDHVHIHELRGFVAGDLDGAFHEAYGISRGTRCKKFLYSLSLSPPETEDVSIDAFETAIESVERRLGFAGQPRAVVFHEKKGRRHAHVVWSRINSETMTAIDPHQDKLRLNEIGRELFLQHGWEMPEGFNRKEDADPFNYSHGEHGQAQRAGRDPKKLKELFADLWQRSDSKSAFEHVLLEQGLVLARGDRRGYVAVDRDGEVFAIARWAGIKTKEVRARLGNADLLPSIEDALDWFEANGAPQPNDNQAKAVQRAKREKLENERLDMVARHRQARAELTARHDERRVHETKSRANRLPTGFKAAWAKLTARYQALCNEIEEDAANCRERDHKEMHGLIQVQLSERRVLQRDIEALELHLEAELPVYDSDPAQSFVLPVDPEAQAIKAKVRRDPVYILDVLTDKRETFSRNDLICELLNHIDDPFAVKVAVERVERSSNLVCLQSKPVPLYSSRSLQNAKAALSDYAVNLSKENDRGVSSRHVKTAIETQNKALKSATDHDLSAEQREAIKHCLGSERIAAVVGLAGAGKSTMLSAVREGYERAGYNVRGAALSGKAADGLESASGIASHTLASLEHSWKGGFGTLSPNDVLVIDEAGMIGTRQLLRFISEVKDAGAKIILVGDPDQLQPINAGTPFREIVETIGAPRLSEIHRQREDWQKRASLDLAEGRIGEALDAYELRGHVVDARNTETAIAKLVNDYINDSKADADYSRLALTYRRKEVHAINQGIREAKKANGELSGEILFKTTTGKRAFAAGDRLLLTRNDRSLGIRNGMFATVKGVTKDQIELLLDRNGDQEVRRITLDTNSYQHFDHGYASTIHKSQGATVDQTYVLGSHLMDRHLTYVAITRHKEKTTLYGDRTSLQKLRRVNVERISSLRRSQIHKPTLH